MSPHSKEFEIRSENQPSQQVKGSNENVHACAIQRRSNSVLTGEKASGTFLIEQARLVDTEVQGVVIKDSGHWLMEEAPRQVIPQLITFINKSIQY